MNGHHEEKLEIQKDLDVYDLAAPRLYVFVLTFLVPSLWLISLPISSFAAVRYGTEPGRFKISNHTLSYKLGSE